MFCYLTDSKYKAIHIHKQAQIVSISCLNKLLNLRTQEEIIGLRFSSLLTLSTSLTYHLRSEFLSDVWMTSILASFSLLYSPLAFKKTNYRNVIISGQFFAWIPLFWLFYCRAYLCSKILKFTRLFLLIPNTSPNTKLENPSSICHEMQTASGIYVSMPVTLPAHFPGYWVQFNLNLDLLHP